MIKFVWYFRSVSSLCKSSNFFHLQVHTRVSTTNLLYTLTYCLPLCSSTKKGKTKMLSTPSDITVIISTPQTSSSSPSSSSSSGLATERRITPTWTVMQLKSKLETMTGIPPTSQRLRVKVPGRADRWVDDDVSTVGEWGLLKKGCEIEVFPTLSLLDACPGLGDVDEVDNVNRYTIPDRGLYAQTLMTLAQSTSTCYPTPSTSRCRIQCWRGKNPRSWAVLIQRRFRRAI